MQKNKFYAFSSILRSSVISLILLIGFSTPSLAQWAKINTLAEPIPTPTAQDTAYVYELRIKNTTSRPIKLARVEVKESENAKDVLETYVSNTLLNNTVAFDGDKPIPLTDKVLLQPNNVAYVYVYLKMPKSAKQLKKLYNTIWLLSLSKDESSVETKVINYAVHVSKMKPLVIGFPFQGGDWVAAAGPSATSYHRRAILGGPFKFDLAQRYAVDWVEARKGSLVEGALNKNKSWHSYGNQVFAVANGVVTKVHDNVPSNTPPTSPTDLKLEDFSGNYIIEKINQNGKDYYVVYAHLQPGEMKVKEGEKIKQGQLIARLGNTGSSSAPHLHIHISDHNNFLNGQGLPFVFKKVKVLGTAQPIFGDYGLYKEKLNTKFAGIYRNIMPTENQVFQIPKKIAQ